MAPRRSAVPVGPAPATRPGPPPEVWARALAGAVAGRGVAAVYQPIVDLARGVVTGYEALARFTHPEIVGGPDVWFAAAAAHGLAGELDAAALRAALAARPKLPGNTFLSVNVEPASLLDRSVRDALASTGPLGGVVIEITEHRTVPVAALEPVLDRLRGDGALIAVDDAGAGYSGLSQILDLRPSILKLDHSLVSGIDRDEAKAAMVEMLGVFAGRIDAWVLAEGIETTAELERVAALGVPLGQGYLLGRPAPPWADLPAEARDCLLTAALRQDEPLRPLVQVVPLVRIGVDDVAAALAGEGVGCALVVDDDLRPRGIVTPAAAVAGEILPALRVGVGTEPAELAHRLSTTATDPSVPAMVTDPTGRALGVVTLPRLLAALARQGSVTGS